MWKLKASIATEGAVARRTGQMSRWQPRNYYWFKKEALRAVLPGGRSSGGHFSKKRFEEAAEENS